MPKIKGLLDAAMAEGGPEHPLGASQDRPRLVRPPTEYRDMAMAGIGLVSLLIPVSDLASRGDQSRSAQRKLG